MRLTFDPTADAAYIYVSESKHVAVEHETCGPTLEEGGAILLGYDSERRLVGIEILGATRLLPPDVLVAAKRPIEEPEQ